MRDFGRPLPPLARPAIVLRCVLSEAGRQRY